MAVTVAMINDLRQRTNAGMMDCKKALVETNGDMDAAVKILREKGLAIQVKRADKESKQGTVQIKSSEDGKTVAMAEVNTETDFVAATDNFKKFVAVVVDKTLEGSADVAGDLKEELMTIVSQTGENVKITRTVRAELEGTGAFATYIHMGGKIGVIVEVGCEKPETVAAPAFAELTNDLTLQIAASAPRYINETEVPTDVTEAEKDIYRNSDDLKGKPAELVEKILIGKIKKFYGEICLVDQPFVKNAPGEKTTVKQVVDKVSKALGDKIVIKRFFRFQLGAK